MNFNDYIIDESDYEFFMSLPKQEKLIFLYDLVCEEVYGSGSISTEEQDEDLQEGFDYFVENHETRLYNLVASTINEKTPVNMLMINNNMIFNSELLSEIELYVTDLFKQGFILIERPLSNRELSIFHQLRYCKVYSMLGRNTISLN
jgi:hypothetical protein